jgi:ribosomal protein S18 acetylase RimI-like enzyme
LQRRSIVKILIGQPKLEKQIKQLEFDIRNNPEADVVIYPEGYLNQNVEQACELAKKYNTMIITGHKKPKDRAIVINRTGEVLLDRAKYEYSPVVQAGELKIGHILCDEIVLQGLEKIVGEEIDLLVHPIGVGMFSEEQFSEWIQLAQEIATKSNTMIIGTSHADGSFRDYDVSIPIAYCFNKNGESIFISKNDMRTRVYDTQTNEIRFTPEYTAISYEMTEDYDFKRLGPTQEIPYDLLLLADPSRELIDQYIRKGICYLAYNKDEIVGEFVLLPTHPNTYEIINVAVKVEYQGRGIGRKLMERAILEAKIQGASSIEIGTGNSSFHQLKLYQKCGFRILTIDHDFFIRNYAKAIFEDGIQCIDMIRLSLDLRDLINQ